MGSANGAEVGDTMVSLHEKGRKGRSFLADLFIRLVKEKPLGTFGAGVVLVLLVVAVFANIIAPYGVNEIHIEEALSPPSSSHLMGTDNVGRDLLSRIIFGARISMYVGFGAAALETLLATSIGIVCGFVGGKVDAIAQRFVDAWMCFPPLVLYLSVMTLIGPGILQVIFVLGLSSGIARSRVVRGAVFAIKENVYVQAAKAVGASQIRTLYKHIFPNVTAPIIILFTVGCGQFILAEATLSFLGFGIPPPAPSWGGMLSQAGRKFMYEAPWMGIWPGLVLSLVIYGVNMFGDAVRDLLDPRLRGGVGRYGGGPRLRKIANETK